MKERNIRIITTVNEMHLFSKHKKREGKKIGFVPTMGYLHEGHLSLVRKAKEISDIVVVSIFVNPTQFAPTEDLSKYPRDIERDKKLLAELGIDAVFIPKAEEIYPEGFQTYVEVDEITKKLEGEIRPTHFKGVTTIVAILFNIVNPDAAVFGQKDAQQAAVIKRMVKDLKFDIEIITAPIVREADGLAMSSRNIYLSPEERKDALVIYKSLKCAEEMIKAGERNTSKIINKMQQIVNSIKISKLDYIKIVELESFEEVGEMESRKVYCILIACQIGKTRLIDNLYLTLGT